MDYELNEAADTFTFTLQVKIPEQFSEDMHHDEFVALATKRVTALEEALQELMNALVKS